jgi:hypothetical protein
MFFGITHVGFNAMNNKTEIEIKFPVLSVLSLAILNNSGIIEL